MSYITKAQQSEVNPDIPAEKYARITNYKIQACRNRINRKGEIKVLYNLLHRKEPVMVRIGWKK